MLSISRDAELNCCVNRFPCTCFSMVSSQRRLALEFGFFISRHFVVSVFQSPGSQPGQGPRASEARKTHAVSRSQTLTQLHQDGATLRADAGRVLGTDVVPHIGHLRLCVPVVEPSALQDDKLLRKGLRRGKARNGRFVKVQVYPSIRLKWMMMVS